MPTEPKMRRCRSCKGPLRVVCEVESQAKVVCGHCGDTYWVESSQDARLVVAAPGPATVARANASRTG